MTRETEGLKSSNVALRFYSNEFGTDANFMEVEERSDGRLPKRFVRSPDLVDIEGLKFPRKPESGSFDRGRPGEADSLGAGVFS